MASTAQHAGERTRPHIRSSKREPCPTCGRNTDGDCLFSEDVVFCHHGSTFSPPQPAPGEKLVTGADGRQWVLVSTADGASGTVSTFILADPNFNPQGGSPGQHYKAPVRRQSAQPQPAAIPAEPVTFSPLTGATFADGFRRPTSEEDPTGRDRKQDAWILQYTPTLLTKRVATTSKDGKPSKDFYPHHLNGSTPVPTNGAGPDPWPLWQQQDLQHLTPGTWVLELEGEACTNHARMGGVIAVSQPGHARSVPQRAERYKAILSANAAGIVYLADNDTAGRKHAQHAAEAAALAGIPFITVHAADLHEHMPLGGSIDDLCRPTDGPRAGFGIPHATAIELILQHALNQQHNATSNPSQPGAQPSGVAHDPDSATLEDLSLKAALKKAISSTHAVRALRLGLELLDEIESPTERFVALQRLKDEAGLSSSKNAFDQAIATLIDEQHNDKDCSLAELMARQHDASWIIDQFGAKGALIGIGGDKGDGKTTLMYQASIAVASGQPLFNELTVEQGPAVIVQCDESDLNARKKFLAIGADPTLPIHWMWGFNPSMLPELKRKIQRTGARFIGIDSITTVAGGRGIKSSDPEYALFLYQLNALAAELGVCIAILIHLRKPDTVKPRSSVGLDDFLGTGMLTAACSDVFGYWPNRQEGAFPDQFVLRCLGKRNCEAGVTWDLQGSKDDYSITFAGVQGGGATPSEQRSTIAKALDFLRQRPGQPFTPSQIGLVISASERTVARLLRDYYSSGNALKIQRIKQPSSSLGGRPSWSWMF